MFERDYGPLEYQLACARAMDHIPPGLTPTSPPEDSADPELVDERSPDRVVLEVARAAGQEVDLVRGDGGQEDRPVGELAVELRPPGRRGLRVGGLQCGGPGDLPVYGRVAELAAIAGGRAIAGNEVAAGELADEGVGGGVVGAPASVDDLSMVAKAGRVPTSWRRQAKGPIRQGRWSLARAPVT